MVLAIVALVVFNDRLGLEIGSVFASVAAGIAALKSKLFGDSSDNSVENQIKQVEDEHSAKRQQWQELREEFSSKYETLKARIEYHDYRAARIISEIRDLDKKELEALKNFENMTEEDILNKLNRK